VPRVDLADRADDKVGSYSIGMRQRLKLASCLLGDPELLILDEPMNGVDPAGRHEMQAMIESLVDDGWTVMPSSHLLDEVERTCDAVAIVDHGRVIRQGSIDELVQGAGTLVVRVDCSDPIAASRLVEESGFSAGNDPRRGGTDYDPSFGRRGGPGPLAWLSRLVLPDGGAVAVPWSPGALGVGSNRIQPTFGKYGSGHACASAVVTCQLPFRSWVPAVLTGRGQELSAETLEAAAFVLPLPGGRVFGPGRGPTDARIARATCAIGLPVSRTSRTAPP
jgi:hypothetical protein